MIKCAWAHFFKTICKTDFICKNNGCKYKNKQFKDHGFNSFGLNDHETWNVILIESLLSGNYDTKCHHAYIGMNETSAGIYKINIYEIGIMTTLSFWYMTNLASGLRLNEIRTNLDTKAVW